MRHSPIALLLAFFIFPPTPAYSDTILLSARKNSLLFFNADHRESQIHLVTLFEGDHYGSRCIVDFHHYSPVLVQIRAELNSLKTQVAKFYENSLSKSELIDFKAKANSFISAVGQLEQVLTKHPINFRSSESCQTTTKKHIDNMKTVFWNPLLQRLRAMARQLSSDITETEKPSK